MAGVGVSVGNAGELAQGNPHALWPVNPRGQLDTFEAAGYHPATMQKSRLDDMTATGGSPATTRESGRLN